jgi:hypothetical protein
MTGVLVSTQKLLFPTNPIQVNRWRFGIMPVHHDEPEAWFPTNPIQVNRWRIEKIIALGLHLEMFPTNPIQVNQVNRWSITNTATMRGTIARNGFPTNPIQVNRWSGWHVLHQTAIMPGFQLIRSKLIGEEVAKIPELNYTSWIAFPTNPIQVNRWRWARSSTSLWFTSFQLIQSNSTGELKWRQTNQTSPNQSFEPYWVRSILF